RSEDEKGETESEENKTDCHGTADHAAEGTVVAAGTSIPDDAKVVTSQRPGSSPMAATKRSGSRSTSPSCRRCCASPNSSSVATVRSPPALCSFQVGYDDLFRWLFIIG